MPTAQTKSLDKPLHTVEVIFHENAKVLRRQNMILQCMASRLGSLSCAGTDIKIQLLSHLQRHKTEKKIRQHLQERVTYQEVWSLPKPEEGRGTQAPDTPLTFTGRCCALRWAAACGSRLRDASVVQKKSC